MIHIGRQLRIKDKNDRRREVEAEPQKNLLTSGTISGEIVSLETQRNPTAPDDLKADEATRSVPRGIICQEQGLGRPAPLYPFIPLQHLGT